MKFLAIFILAIACVCADPDPKLTEWTANYGTYPTSRLVALTYSPKKAAAPLFAAPLYAPSKLKAPLYWPMAAKAYTIPEGYRVSYDPENFNDAFGYYPEYKK